ncbi:hypothetical protein BGZ94_004282 [Podila epigama]|nr:hypothetical protein BGZ94_004282 [Podila epigama]
MSSDIITPLLEESVQFRHPPEAAGIITLFLSLVCISIMALLFGRKTASTTLRSLNYVRSLVVGLYFSSWLFAFTTPILVQTNEYNKLSCEMSVFICIILYVICKILIYLFLVERVYVVTTVGVTRKNSWMYRFNVALLIPYFGIFCLGIYLRNATIIPNGNCEIGLKKASPTKRALREVAKRSLIGSIVALVLSTANIAILVIFEGHQRSMFCLASCSIDVTLNAIAIHWVTSIKESKVSKCKDNNGNVHPDNRRMEMDGMGPRGRPDPPVANQGMYRHDVPLEPQKALDTHISVNVESFVEEYQTRGYGARNELPELSK